VSAVVAGALPTHADDDRHAIRLDARPGKPVGPGAVLGLRVGDRRVVVHPPPGWSVLRVGEGDASHANVVLSDETQSIVVLFRVPVGAERGETIGNRDGTPIRLTRVGATWRSPDGFLVFVAGPDAPTSLLVDVILGIELT
jgi:hypothetical protein